MKIVDQQTQEQITDLINACKTYWEIRGVPLTRCNEMSQELEQHLQQAVNDGKSLEDVVGTNPAAFAEAWAREMRPRFSAGGTVVLHGLAIMLSALSSTALVEHLLTRSPSFSFTFFYLYSFASSGLLALLIQLSGFLSPRMRREGRTLLVFAVFSFLPSILVIAILRLAGIKLNLNVEFLSWPWPVTVFLLLIAVILFYLDIRLCTGRGYYYPTQNSQTRQYFKTFVSCVVAIDICFLLVRFV